MPVPETRFTTSSDGFAIAYQVIGDGQDDLVFLPLFGCIDQVWDDPEYDHLLRRLARLGRLILLDVRGLGASDPLPDGVLPTPEKWTDDLRAVLDSVGSTSSSIVAAGPYGILAACFAATYPERTKALVLIDTYARWLQTKDYAGGTPEVRDVLIQLFRDTWGTGFSTALSMPSRREDKEFRRWLARTERLTCSPTQVSTYWSWALTLDVRDVLPVIGAPTLVVFNRPNNIALLEHSQYLADHISRSELTLIDRRENYLLHRAEGDHLLDRLEEFLTGAPPMQRNPMALSTVLFTDIVGSTEHAIRLGDEAWTDLLVKHDQLVDAEVDRHLGQRVSSTGDGWLMTFDGPEGAIRCACAMSEAVRGIGLAIRVGVHTGAVQRRGTNIHGLAVHIAARVAASAGPEEVLVSSTVRELVAGSGFRFEDRGDHDLKGIPDAWRIYAVVGHS